MLKLESLRHEKVKNIGDKKCAANEWEGKKGSSININTNILTVTLVAY